MLAEKIHDEVNTILRLLLLDLLGKPGEELRHCRGRAVATTLRRSCLQLLTRGVLVAHRHPRPGCAAGYHRSALHRGRRAVVRTRPVACRRGGNRSGAAAAV